MDLNRVWLEDALKLAVSLFGKRLLGLLSDRFLLLQEEVHSGGILGGEVQEKLEGELPVSDFFFYSRLEVFASFEKIQPFGNANQVLVSQTVSRRSKTVDFLPHLLEGGSLHHGLELLPDDLQSLSFA